MKVEIIHNDDLIIKPGTEFETMWLRNFEIGKVFHKTGVTASEYLGLKISRKQIIVEEECLYLFL